MKNKIKPFLKWAGGKNQLIEEISEIIPKNIDTYIEPFIGGGAILFWVLNNLPNVKNIIINDINLKLINSYKVIKDNIDELINILRIYENEYHDIDKDEELKKLYYYNKREIFNLENINIIEQTALFIFLNKTCFNGLYRVNKKNQFNVPIGNYSKPLICDEENLRNISKALKNTTIICADYEETLSYINNSTFFYLDPPYKPLNETSYFTAYNSTGFCDNEQIRLKEFCLKINEQKWLLTNSDVGNNFFYDMYKDFKITKVLAKRSINSNSEKRGKINELIITNF